MRKKFIYFKEHIMKIEITGVAETMLITVYARAVETLKKEPRIEDAYAVEMVKKLDYDFEQYKNARMSLSGVVFRTMLFDEITKDFISRNPEAVIVNLGAGLDARFFRVDNGKILWYDIDLPEVMEIRKHFFKDSRRCKMISKSMFDYTWIKEIEKRDGPVLFVGEGLLMFLSGERIKEFFGKLQENFPRGEILNDILSLFISKNSKRHDTIKKTKARFSWGVNDPKEMETLVPGLSIKKQTDFLKYGREDWKIFWLITRIPPLKKLFGMWVVNARLNKD